MRPKSGFFSSGRMLKKGGNNALGKLTGALPLLTAGVGSQVRPYLPLWCRTISDVGVGMQHPDSLGEENGLDMPVRLGSPIFRPNICLMPGWAGQQPHMIWQELATLGLKGGSQKAPQQNRGSQPGMRGSGLGRGGRGRGRGASFETSQDRPIIYEAHE